MSEFKVSVDFSDLGMFKKRLHTVLAKRVNDAVIATAFQIQEKWKEAIYRAPGVWQVEKERYAQSLQVSFESMDNFGRFYCAATIWTDYEVADLIENGRPARDLKKMLNTSDKVRRTKDGRRFLVIPFRHNTPGHSAHAPAMSKQAYAMAKGLKLTTTTADHQSRLTGQIVTLSPRTGMRPAAVQTPFASSISTRGPLMTHYAKTYDWGGRLTAKALRAAGMDEADVKRYAGMVRTKDSAGRSRSAGYLTFRMMMDGQSGWVVPAKPGLHIVQSIVDELNSAAFEEAIRERVFRGIDVEAGLRPDGSSAEFTPTWRGIDVMNATPMYKPSVPRRK